MKQNKKLIIFSATFILLLGLFYYYFKFLGPFSKTKYVARVNGQMILRSDYEKQVSASKHFFLWAKQDLANIPSLEKDVLNKMVDAVLISQYAAKRKIKVTDEEVKQSFLQSFSGKKQTEEEYLKKINEMYGLDKEAVLKTIKSDLLKEKIKATLEINFSDWLKEQREKAKVINSRSTL